MQPRICISDPELAKHVLSNKSGFYVKPKHRPSAEKLAGKGLSVVNGLEWAKRRRTVNPAFTIDKLKVMTRQMAACTISMIEEWKNQANASEEQGKTMEMNGEFKKLMADVIAHTAFGSSFLEGKEAFKGQIELQKCCAAASADIFIPGSQYLPTPSNIQVWKLDRKVKNTLRGIIESRLKATKSSGHYGDDLIGVMIEASEIVQTGSGPKLTTDEMVEECKTFFFAGHETTANSLTWTVFLLSVHQEWQEKLREEIRRECGMGIPDADMLSKLKMVNMVLLEALRLYSPVIRMVRKGSEDSQIGNLTIPKDICIEIAVIKIHRSKKYWGEDANEFHPLRFANGISKAAKHPNALLAFGFGPRVCIGQNFAMLAEKMAIALILQNFSLSLSPEYKHAPVDSLIMQPQYGLPIIIKPLS
ncbi:putative Cytochrome P450 [Melia azedarach]|nr:putative Cytochrome P450 [Melia azedarach]